MVDDFDVMNEYYVNAFPVISQDVIKPLNNISRLEDGTYDDNLYPLLVVGELNNKKCGVAFHMTSKRKGLKHIYEKFTDYQLISGKNIDYSKENHSRNSFVSTQQFSLLSYKDYKSCKPKYAHVSEDVIKDIVAQHYFLLEQNIAVSELLFDNVNKDFLNSYDYINRVSDFKKVCEEVFEEKNTEELILKIMSNSQYQSLSKMLQKPSYADSIEKYRNSIKTKISEGVKKQYSEYNPLILIKQDDKNNLVYGFRMSLYNPDLSYTANELLNYKITRKSDIQTEKKNISKYRGVRANQLVIADYHKLFEQFSTNNQISKDGLVFITSKNSNDIILDILSHHLYLIDNNMAYPPEILHDDVANKYKETDTSKWIENILKLMSPNMKLDKLRKREVYINLTNKNRDFEARKEVRQKVTMKKNKVDSKDIFKFIETDVMMDKPDVYQFFFEDDNNTYSNYNKNI